MITGKPICPAGKGRKMSDGVPPAGKRLGLISRLRNLFRTAPAAFSGDSGKVMENYIKFIREHGRA